MSPVSSGGTLAINPVGPNQRVTDNETLNITSHSLILNTTHSYTTDLPAQVNFTPSHVYINISGIESMDLTTTGTFGANVSGKSWKAIVNLTPRSVHYNETRSVDCPVLGGACNIHYNAGDQYIGTDITLSVVKRNLSTMQNIIVYQNISQNTIYSIDLMNDEYGLNPIIGPGENITLIREIASPSGNVLATGNVTYGFTEMNPYTITPIPLGSVEYQSQTSYWIRQNYYYQMGGVFLEQVDGNTTYKLPPEITFAYDPAHPNILVVNLNALSVDPNLASNHGIVGGNSPIQLKTTLTNITTMPFVAGTANTREITISVNTTDSKARAMWRDYFDYTAKVAGIPPADYDASILGTRSYITLYGYDHSATGDYDINVVMSNATYMTTVHGVGGIVQ
jgi:hypothetical protein